MNILILTQDEVETLLTMEACISVMAEAMAALARGHVYQPMRMMVRPPSAAGIMALMPSYMAGAAGQAFYGLKAMGVFHGNPAKGKDAHQGAVLLYSGETGELLSLMNGSAITAIRTAAISGLATRLLARPDASDLAIIGSGIQARSHLAAIHCVRPLKRARVASRTVDHARKFTDELGPHFPFPIEPVAAIEEAVHGADLVVTATTASTPIIKRDWIAPGAHLNVIGAYTPTTREVDSATIAAARLFVDRRESALSEAGDVLLAMQEGAIDAGHICAEIGEVLIGSQPGRTTAEEITLFKSLGLPVEDLAAAEYLYRRALETGTGTIVPF
jgi:ornithine cyclodeaminase/alanine dehydrogenase-like protein (mu-crystallin family)